MVKTDFPSFPLLETERLQLRKLTVKDAEDMFVLRTNDEVMKYLDRDKLKSVEAAKKMIEDITKSINEGTGRIWGVSLKAEKKLIGTIGYWRMDKQHYRGELGYVLHPDYFRLGIMSEAIKKIIDFGFDEMNLHSIEAIVNPSNLGSIRLLEKNNFVREAYFRENYYYDGKFLDSAVYSLVKSWRK